MRSRLTTLRVLLSLLIFATIMGAMAAALRDPAQFEPFFTSIPTLALTAISGVFLMIAVSGGEDHHPTAAHRLLATLAILAFISIAASFWLGGPFEASGITTTVIAASVLGPAIVALLLPLAGRIRISAALAIYVCIINVTAQHSDSPFLEIILLCAAILSIGNLLIQLPLPPLGRWLAYIGTLFVAFAVYLGTRDLHAYSSFIEDIIALAFIVGSMFAGVTILLVRPTSQQGRSGTARTITTALIIELLVVAAGAVFIASTTGIQRNWYSEELAAALMFLSILLVLQLWSVSNLHKSASLAAFGLMAVLAADMLILFLSILFPIAIAGHDLVGNPEDQLDLLFAVGVPSVIFLRYRSHPELKAACRFALAMCVIIFVFVRIVITNEFPDLEKYGWLFAAILQFGFFTTPLLIDHGNGGGVWRWIGIISAAAYSVLFAVDNAPIHQYPGNVPQWIGAMAIVSAATAMVFAHGNVILRIAGSTAQKILAWGTIALVAVIWILVGYNSWLSGPIPGTYQWPPGNRMIAAGSILYGGGVLAIILLRGINRQREFANVPTATPSPLPIAPALG